MKKFDWNGPFTRKDYAILVMVLLPIYLGFIGIIYWDDIKSWTGEKIEKIRKRFRK